MTDIISMINVTDAISHIRDREYMSGVERDKLRTKSTGNDNG